jgi:aryl-alcohol dehydrogenase-like predicted oxidoreductase
MAQINRRTFMKQAGTMAAAVSMAPSGAFAATPKAAAKCSFGTTGLTPTLLGVGTGTHAWNGHSDQNKQGRDAFVGLLSHAYNRGLRYFDLADMYGSHDYMRDAIVRGKMNRDELFLLTKTVSKTAVGVLADVERFRQEIQTDVIDVVLLHCMTKADWTTQLAPCMDALSEAKAKGRVRAVGVSCHTLDALSLAAETPWVDVMLSRVNPWGVKMKMDAEPEIVLPILKKAHDSGKGMLGMKILGEGKNVEGMEESLKFVLGSGVVDAITIGFMEPKQIDEVMAKIDEVSA